ncbi:hypothetical protein Glove_715g4 [Diversispora epigaea]|uniref:Uncharacterized protein n=1 Tax=Diversispora epigaea TaxID=1348612 RepID=A0A397G1P3_9GLOM|nr:hypothetical protein Glove_715g4 [Diversispora epigaea]
MHSILTKKVSIDRECTINLDNSKLRDDKCLQYALGVYFASNNGVKVHLECLSVIKPYLDIVNLDGIPIPTLICSRTFQKIKAQNLEISINTGRMEKNRMKEEIATFKTVIVSKNFFIPNSYQVAECNHPRPNEYIIKRPHIIYLMALTDINKSEDTGKYDQRNHFL